MSSLEWIIAHPKVLLSVVTGLGGYLTAMFVGYVRFGQDLSYIKGQLQSILDLHETIKELSSKHAILEKDTIQNIRAIEKTIARLHPIKKEPYYESLD